MNLVDEENIKPQGFTMTGTDAVSSIEKLLSNGYGIATCLLAMTLV